MESAEQAGHLHFGPPVSPRTETRICLWGETVYALTANCTLSKVAYQGDGASIPYKFLEARADGETGSVVALSRNGGDWTQWHVDGYDSHYSFVPLEIPGYRQGDKEWHFWVGDSQQPAASQPAGPREAGNWNVCHLVQKIAKNRQLHL